MSKQLSPPEVVQALLDGKEVVRTIGWKYRFTRGAFEVDTHDRLGWRSCTLGVHELLLTASTTWSIVPEHYNWAEARKRMRVSGKRCRPVSVDYSFYADGGRYFVSGGGPFEWRDDFFDGEWTDA